MVDVESMCFSCKGFEKSRTARSRPSKNNEQFPTADQAFEVTQNLYFSLSPACNFVEKTDDFEQNICESSRQK